MNGQARAEVKVIEDARGAAAMLRPMRLRLLEELREPHSAASLARKLDQPRQKINYHLRELEKQGFIELVEERQKGNCIERVVRATARSYLVSPDALGALAADPDDVEDHLSSAYLVAIAARAIRDVSDMRPRARAAGKQLPTLTLNGEVRFASAADQNGFAEELASAVAKLVAKYHDDQSPGGRAFHFLIGAYPARQRSRKGRESK